MHDGARHIFALQGTSEEGQKIERIFLEEKYKYTQSDKKLGISRTTLSRKLREWLRFHGNNVFKQTDLISQHFVIKSYIHLNVWYHHGLVEIIIWLKEWLVIKEIFHLNKGLQILMSRILLRVYNNQCVSVS